MVVIKQWPYHVYKICCYCVVCRSTPSVYCDIYHQRSSHQAALLGYTNALNAV